MLFQTLGSHGQKLSRSMWEDCLWSYVFPTLDYASHLVISKDSWNYTDLPFLSLTEKDFFFRLQPHQKMNGKVKNLELAKAKQYICLYITGILIFWLLFIKNVFFFPPFLSAFLYKLPYTIFTNIYAVGIPLKNSGMRHLHWCWVELPGFCDPFFRFLEL